MQSYPEYQRLAPASLHSQAATNLPLVEENQATGEVAALYERFHSEFGRPQVPGILKCFATHPPLLRSMIDLAQGFLFTEGSLTRRQKEMIATLVSRQNDCAYCTDSHGYFFRIHGGSSEALKALLQNSIAQPVLSEAESALLHFVTRVNSASQAISPADANDLLGAGWNQAQIAEAVHLTALFAMFNRVANAFGLESQCLIDRYEDESH